MTYSLSKWEYSHISQKYWEKIFFILHKHKRKIKNINQKTLKRFIKFMKGNIKNYKNVYIFN